MKPGQPDRTANVVRLRTRSNSAVDSHAGPRDDNIIRLLDLSKYEHPRPGVENDSPNIRANIAAIVLLAFLVFIAKEDFCRLERANLCAASMSCFN